jgi:Predicted metal-binding, possibly nucleic acid-binding protein
METGTPLQHFFDLGDLTQAGSDVAVVAAPESLESLAEWADVDAVKAFSAAVHLKRVGQNRFALEAELSADVVQACVVTLEPVESHISRKIARELHLSPKLPAEAGELTLSAGDDDVPETILSLQYDLAGPLLEEFALAIDPYPRKEGAAFAPPVDSESAKESPFAVLKALKDKE